MADNNSSSTGKVIVAALGALAAIAPLAMNYRNSTTADAPSAAPPALSVPAESVATPPAPDRVSRLERPVISAPDPITAQRSEVRRGGGLPGDPLSGVLALPAQDAVTEPSRPTGSVRPFAEARAFARGLRLMSQAEWDLFAVSAAKPADIPENPTTEYRDQGWVSWNDWLGRK